MRSSSRSLSVPLRGTLLMPLCALIVHQARYYLAFGGHAGSQLARSGHGYFSVAEPLVLLTAALAAGAFLGRLAQAWQRPESESDPRHRLVRTWALCSVALLVLFCAQELAEGMFTAAHPAGLAGIVDHGGWIAAPAALGVGAALATVLSVTQALIHLAATSAFRRRARRGKLALPRPRGGAPVCRRLSPMSGAVAGRAPPIAAA